VIVNNSTNINKKRTTTSNLKLLVCQRLAAGRYFSPGTPVSSTNETNRHDITEILLKMSLNTKTLTLTLKLLNTKRP